MVQGRVAGVLIRRHEVRSRDAIAVLSDVLYRGAWARTVTDEKGDSGSSLQKKTGKEVLIANDHIYKQKTHSV